jgi:ABC-type sugar transport system ATPase subunit
VDVGAKAQVHKIVRELAASGVATLVISSEMQELLALCDRLLVVREGHIVGDLSCASATQEEVLLLALPDAGKEVTR